MNARNYDEGIESLSFLRAAKSVLEKACHNTEKSQLFADSDLRFTPSEKSESIMQHPNRASKRTEFNYSDADKGIHNIYNFSNGCRVTIENKFFGE